MNHAKLHKTSRFKRNEAESSDGKVSRRSRRRSIVQKGERNDIVSKMRKLSPLKETSNASKKAMVSREERLRIWKIEKAKRLMKVKANAKPVFRVGTGSSFKNISVESKELSANKENKKKSNLPKEKLPKPQKDIPCTSSVVTRQQKKDFKNIKKADKPKQKIPVRNKKPSAKKGAEVQLKQDKGDQEGSSAEKKTTSKSKENNSERIQNMEIQDVQDLSEIQDMKDYSGVKKSDSAILVKQPSCSKDSVEESELDSSVEDRKTSQGECGEPAKPCEVSFAPGNFTFQVPASLNKFVFPDVFPNSNSQNTTDVKGNYLSSTPNNVLGRKNIVGPVIPLALTSGNEERVRYFRELVRSESESLNASCEYWNEVKQSNESELNEEVLGEIRSVIGQAQLLIAERFNQFSKLIDKFKNKPKEEKPVHAADLQGFWDMIYYQVVDVGNKFTELRELKENKWIKESHEETETNKKAKQVTRRKPGKSVAEKKCIEAARKASKHEQNTVDKNDGDEIQTNVKLDSGSDSDVQQRGSGVLLDSLDNSPTTVGLIDMKYLIPCDTSCIDTPEQVKPDSETRTQPGTPPTFLHSTAATEGFFNTPGNSPAHVLRSRKIAPCSSGMSPLLCVKSAAKANVQNMKLNESIDLISFSPVGTASEYNRETSGPLTRQTASKEKDESFSLI